MASEDNASRINAFLILIVGLLVGGIAGYVVGHSSVNTSVAGTAYLNLNDVISNENAWIVEGLTCPMPGCTNPLLTCQGELPRRIRDWVNSQLAVGRPGQDIRAEIIRTHGANVQKLQSPAVVPDTIRNITD
ncbi:MAG: hypothetical protein Kow0074_01050 [Candidatus Zixiibacteriota bacterium]